MKNEAKNNRSFNLSSPPRQDFVDWVHPIYVFLQQSKTTIQRSFKVSHIITTTPGLFCYYDFSKKING